MALAPNAAKATLTEGDRPRADDGSKVFSVSEELQSIRDAVDQASTEMQGGQTGQINDRDIRLAWWLNTNGRGWGNGGLRWLNGGYPAWLNVRPWGNGWGNGGWRTAGPGHNGWRNF